MSEPTHTVNLTQHNPRSSQISQTHLRIPILRALEERDRDALCEDVENKHTLKQLCIG